METKIFLIRHGETEWNQQKRFQGSKDSSLTDLGKEQALLAKKSLEFCNIDKGYASPMKRAQDTLAIILKDTEIEFDTIEGIREIHLGPWEGKTYQEARENYLDEYLCFKESPSTFKLDGAETLMDVQKRVVEELESIFTKDKNKNVLVVSHGISIKAAIAHYSSIPLTDWPKLPHPQNGSYFCLTKNGGNVSVEPQVL